MHRSPHWSRIRFWLEAAAVGGFFAVIPVARAQVPILTNPSEVNNATIDQLFIFQITATNHPTAFGASGPLPPGLSLLPNDSLGIISGFPEVDGSTGGCPDRHE